MDENVNSATIEGMTSAANNNAVTTADSANIANRVKLPYSNVIPPSGDVNDMKAPGCYWISKNNAHYPNGASDYALLLVITQNETGGVGSGYNYQILLGTNSIVFIRYSWNFASASGGWSNWYKFAGTVVS